MGNTAVRVILRGGMSGAGKELREKIRYQSCIDMKTRNGGAEGQHVCI